MFWETQPSGSNWSGVWVLVVSMQLLLPPGGSFSICKTTQEYGSGYYLSALEEELKVSDFVLWLNYYYFVLLDCFPLFLHFLNFLIKFVLWNSGTA